MRRLELTTSGAASVLALLCIPRPASAQVPAQPSAEPPAPDVTQVPAPSAARPWYEAIQVNGFLSIYAETNFNRPPSHTSQFRVFDSPADSFEIPVAELVVQKAISAPSESGFRLDLAAGSTVPSVSAASGLFRDPATGEAEDFDLQQAYASWIAPVGNGLRFDAGKYVTFMGSEVIEGYDGWNDNATRSFLFGFAIPFTHTGLRMSYGFNSQFSAQLHIVNGWDDARDNNSAKSIGAQLGYTPSPALSFYLNVISGPEQAGNDSDSRDVADLAALWKTTSQLTLGLNADYGTEDGAALSGGDAIWSGVAGYARYGFTPRFALALRAEEFDDRDGARTGIDQHLREITLTPEFRVDEHLRIRLDLRHDWSDQASFETDDGMSKGQTTALVNVLWSF
jgi:hypothetical protein